MAMKLLVGCSLLGFSFLVFQAPRYSPFGCVFQLCFIKFCFTDLRLSHYECSIFFASTMFIFNAHFMIDIATMPCTFLSPCLFSMFISYGLHLHSLVQDNSEHDSTLPEPFTTDCMHFWLPLSLAQFVSYNLFFLFCDFYKLGRMYCKKKLF